MQMETCSLVRPSRSRVSATVRRRPASSLIARRFVISSFGFDRSELIDHRLRAWLPVCHTCSPIRAEVGCCGWRARSQACIHTSSMIDPSILIYLFVCQMCFLPTCRCIAKIPCLYMPVLFPCDLLLFWFPGQFVCAGAGCESMVLHESSMSCSSLIQMSV
ncbi:hypothetical protein BRADI_1g32636v3 [Brachypodium distachyon]|uniref:Uncharacterized protein n=1 Tax=Brachypodium distachyon TaxID=15368 RepID=A0A0Q3RWB4_BRADI|nr:hypothetical protein BRADI_1g32636v3 [Brachypodium distachyon]